MTPLVLSYLTLFSAAFAAASILPFYSELAVVGMLAAGRSPVAVLVVAAAGNTLGAVVNWVLGRYLLHFKERRWFPVGERQLERAQRWFQRYGVWSLLLAWMPVGGDALTVIAGIMRVRLDVFVVLTGIGKTLRYAVLIFFVDATL